MLVWQISPVRPLFLRRTHDRVWSVVYVEKTDLIGHVDNVNIIFRCTIRSKYTKPRLLEISRVIITYSLLVYYLYSRSALPDFPPHYPYPSTAATAIVLDHIIKFVQNLQYFQTIINISTPKHRHGHSRGCRQRPTTYRIRCGLV